MSFPILSAASSSRPVNDVPPSSVPEYAAVEPLARTKDTPSARYFGIGRTNDAASVICLADWAVVAHVGHGTCWCGGGGGKLE